MQRIGQYTGIEDFLAIVDVQGSYRLEVTDKVRSELEEAYRRGCTSVRFEMGGTDYIDSAVTKLIIRTMRRVGAEKLEIRNPKGRVFAALDAAAMTKYIKSGGQ